MKKVELNKILKEAGLASIRRGNNSIARNWAGEIIKGIELANVGPMTSSDPVKGAWDNLIKELESAGMVAGDRTVPGIMNMKIGKWLVVLSEQRISTYLANENMDPGYMTYYARVRIEQVG